MFINVSRWLWYPMVIQLPQQASTQRFQDPCPDCAPELPLQTAVQMSDSALALRLSIHENIIL